MTQHDPLDHSPHPTERLPRRTLGAAEWRLLLIAAGLVLAAYALVSQLPRWLGW